MIGLFIEKNWTHFFFLFLFFIIASFSSYVLYFNKIFLGSENTS